MDAERSGLEIVSLPPREQLDHVLQIEQTVVYRRGRQQKELLFSDEPVELPVAGTRIVFIALEARVPEVMGFVEDHSVGHLRHVVQPCGELALAE